MNDGVPIQVVSIGNGKFKLNPEFEQLMKQLEGPIGVIVVTV